MAETPSGTNPENRVILWGVARSLSTVFEKCMSFVDGIQIINEPFQCACTVGPEGFMAKQQPDESTNDFINDVNQSLEKMDSGGTGWDDKYCTYKWVKTTLDDDYPGKKLLFCKDLISGIHGKYDYLPKGFQHTFIIRNPVRVALSLYKGVREHFIPPGTPSEEFDMTEIPILNMLPGYGFGEMLDLIDHLKKIGEMTSDPIIIDADDMQNHPESIVSQYCEKTGIPFSKSLLTWEAGDGIVRRSWMISKGFLEVNKIMHYFDAAFASTEFQPAKDVPSSLPPDVVKYAAKCEPHYNKLYEMRIKP